MTPTGSTTQSWSIVAVVCLLLAGSLCAAPAVSAQQGADADVDAGTDTATGPQIVQRYRVPMSDGVELLVQVGGRGPLVDGELPARPIIAEFTPYGQACCPEYGGADFNHLQVHIRGTGDSNGAFDALGPRSQQDLVETMAWACAQPFSNGTAGLWGFSASAIMTYNSLHAEIPCLETAVMGSGTHELYRDLMYPGGIPNLVPAVGVFALIGAPAIALGPDRLGRDPLSVIDAVLGMADTGIDYLAHPSLDGWWRQRGFRGDANEVPILMIDGFFDVESRGAFEAFRDIGGDSHLYVVGAHDGIPVGSGGADEPTRRWFRHHLLGEDNGIDAEPTVQLWMANGDRVDMLNGDFVTASGADWPLPGTRWETLYLDPEASGTANSLNDGTLAIDAPEAISSDTYLPLPSLPTATDPATTSLLGIFNGATELTMMNLPETLGLSYTTAPLEAPVDVAGPMSMELDVTTTAPQTDLYAVLSDVWPDGSAHPMAHGRLRTAYPELDPDRTRRVDGEVVQPYSDFSRASPVPPGTEHRYFVEFFPVGNRFKAGHRLRLHIVGASAFSLPTTPGLNEVRLGGADGGSLLRVPVLPGSDLLSALGAADATVAPPATDPAATPSAAAADNVDHPAVLPVTGRSAPWPFVLILLAAAALARSRRPTQH